MNTASGYDKGTMNRILILFLTIVLTPTEGFPANPSPGQVIQNADAILPDEKNPKTIKESSGKKPLDQSGFTLGQPKEKQVEHVIRQQRIFPYQEGLGNFIGAAIDKEDGEFKFPLVLGFFYRKLLMRKYELEFAASLQDNSKGVIAADYMYYISRNLLRIYAKAGASVVIVAEEKLATFSNSENYRANLAIGMEDLLHTPLSFKFEAGARVGLGPINGYLILGYSWAW